MLQKEYVLLKEKKTIIFFLFDEDECNTEEKGLYFFENERKNINTDPRISVK